MDFRDDFARLLRECLRDADDWMAVEHRFRAGVDEDEERDVDDARPITFAFGYMLVASRREQIRERVGAFGSQFEGGGMIFPPRLQDIEPDMLDVWAAYAAATDGHPLAASRLHDLLWVRRHGARPDEHARVAFDAYLDLATSSSGMALVDCLLRAIEIAVEINDGDRLASAVARSLEVSRTEIADPEERRPGIPMSLLEALVDLAPDRRPVDLDPILDAAAERYGEDPYIAESVNELKMSLRAPDEREGLQRRQVARWREEAGRGDALLRHLRLQQALGLARTYGFTETAQEILLEMQAIDSADFDLKPITAQVEMPRADVEEFVESFVKGSASWGEAFRRLGAEGPPSGDAAANRKLNAELAEKYPLHRIFPSMSLGPHGSLTSTAADADGHDRADLSRHEAMRIRIWASLGIEILDAIRLGFEISDRGELTAHFTTEFIDREVAARIADGVLRFFDGDDDGALHILVPQLEAAIRAAASRAGVVVIRMPRGGTPGGVRALGGILADLEGRLDESWRRFLVNALTDPLGINLRNQLSHGLHGPTTRGDVAVAIQIACHIALWKSPASDAEGGDDGSAI